ncbi:MAG: SMI1/KNR4 family protein [Polyangiaceae bacterium]
MPDSMSSNRIATAWGAVEAWLLREAPEVASQLRQPATPEEWDAAIGVWPHIPTALREFYGLHGGGEAALVGEDWFSLSQAIHQRTVWLDLLAEFESVAIQAENWFPFGGSGDGTYALDLKDGSVWESEAIDHAERVAESLAEFLEILARDVEADVYVVDPEEGILHRDFESPGCIGKTHRPSAEAPVEEQLLALVELRRELTPSDLSALETRTPEELETALDGEPFSAHLGTRMRASYVVARALGSRGADWARRQLANATLEETRFSIAGLCLPETDAIAWAWRQPKETGRDIQAFGRLALPGLLDVLEGAAETLQPRAEWGEVAYRSGIDWLRVKRWLDQGGSLALIAFDAVAHPYLLSPREAPIHQDSKEIVATLSAALERQSTPRTKRAVRTVFNALGSKH